MSKKGDILLVTVPLAYLLLLSCNFANICCCMNPRVDMVPHAEFHLLVTASGSCSHVPEETCILDVFISGRKYLVLLLLLLSICPSSLRPRYKSFMKHQSGWSNVSGLFLGRHASYRSKALLHFLLFAAAHLAMPVPTPKSHKHVHQRDGPHMCICEAVDRCPSVTRHENDV